MKRIAIYLTLMLAISSPAWAVSKEIVQLQQSVQLLTDQIRDLTRLVTERFALMTQLVEKASDSTNKLQASVDNVQRSVQGAITAQSTDTSRKFDSQTARLQQISDSV